MSEETQAEIVLLSAKDAAALMGVPRTKIKQWDSEGLLITVQREGNLMVPEKLLAPSEEDRDVLRPLWNAKGTIVLLRDARFQPEEALQWLYTDNEELGSTPIDALRAQRHKHVNRIAQTLGF